MSHYRFNLMSCVTRVSKKLILAHRIVSISFPEAFCSGR